MCLTEAPARLRTFLTTFLHVLGVKQLTCVCVCVRDGFDSMSSCLQKVLSEMQTENQQRLKDRQQELKDLKKVMEVMKVGQQAFCCTQHVFHIVCCGLLRHPVLSCPVHHAQRSADRVHDDTEYALSELQRSVERLQELLEEVLDQAGLEKMGQAQEVADSLEAEIKVLKKRDTEIQDLAQCEDHIYYLQV